MKILHDVTCKRCGCTTSGMWVDPQDLINSHICPDGERSDSLVVSDRVVLGPGERGKDDEHQR